MLLQIRMANINDVKKLATLETNAFAKDKFHILTTKHYKYLLTKANAEIWIICKKDNVIASGIIFYNKKWSHCRLYSIAVKPDFQGQGLGTKLLNHIEDVAKKKGLTGIRQEIRQDASDLLNRYLKKGYHVYQQKLNYYPDGIGCIKLKKAWLNV